MKAVKYFGVLILLCSFFSIQAQVQGIVIEGYTFEDDNRGFLNEVKITILDQATNSIVSETISDRDGKFICEVPSGRTLIVRASKDIFLTKEEIISTVNKPTDQIMYVKVKMKRKPGYLLELTLAETRREDEEEVTSVTGTHIEIYNNTKRVQELDLKNHPSPIFKYTLNQGNHYTFLIRKDGYLNKRIEAFVNIKGCILCVDGVSNLGPGVSDNLTKGFEMGTLLANLEMDRAELNKTMIIENIYYDYDKSYIRSDAEVELDKLATFLKQNPGLIVELGSHTDSRGKDQYNLELSQKRADAAVKYILKKGGIDPERIESRGYGEQAILNKCRNRVPCEEEEHQKNRRTEIRIIGFSETDPYAIRTLEEIILLEEQEALIGDFGDSDVIEITSADQLPEELRKQIEKDTKTKIEIKEVEEEMEEESMPDDIAIEQTEVYPSNQQIEVPSNQQTEVYPSDQQTEVYPSTPVIEDTPFKDNVVVNDPSPANPPVETTGTGVEVPITTQTSALEVPVTFNGYKIEIIGSKTPLAADHPIFSKHGKVAEYKNNSGTYSYLLGEFRTAEDGEVFMQNFLVSMYPNARVVNFKNGRKYFQ